MIVANPEGPYILLNNSQAIELSGYVNNKVEPGEVIGITIELRNYGQSDGNSVTAQLSTVDNYVTISDGSEYCGTIPAQSTLEFENAFSIIIDKDIPDGHEVEFVVNILDPSQDSWSSDLSIILSAPVLNLNSLTIDDLQGGNGNGMLDPGENVTITATFSNKGHAIARNTVANLCAHSGFISIANPDHTIGNLGLFGGIQVHYQVSVDNKAPVGILADFMVNLTAEAYELHETHHLKIGMIYEDFESGDFTKFPWNSGGNAPWTVISQYPYEGFYSIRSGAIGNSQTSEISLNYSVLQADSISFIKKVSSAGGDSLKFMVDGIVRGAWAGTTTGWKRVSYYITPGNHVFKWVYMKDGNGSAGSDAAWVDYIVFPPILATTIYAGEDEMLCSGEVFSCNGQATNFQSTTWTTSGTGAFNNPTSLTAVYTPGAEDLLAGSVELFLSVLDVNGESFSDDMLLSFTDIPGQPGMPTGPDNVLIDDIYVSEYSVDPVAGAMTYQWHVDPPGAGIFTGDGATGTIVWDRDFGGMAYINAFALNDCGEGIASESLEVTVDNSAVGLGELAEVPFTVNVYPNPVSEALNIIVSGENVNNLEIRLVDLMGRVVQRCKGYNPCRVSVTTLNPGLYILVVKSENYQLTRKIIVK